MPRRSDARQKMIVSQALLQRERGVAGTALPDVLEHSGAPRGSIYHHFPAGRAQLAQEATAWAADFTSRRLEALLAAGDVPAAIDAFVADYRDALEQTGFAAGCPIVAGALDDMTREVAARGFRRWEASLTEALADRPDAEALAVTIIAAIEGAIVLARAEGTSRPLDRVAAQLQALLQPWQPRTSR